MTQRGIDVDVRLDLHVNPEALEAKARVAIERGLQAATEHVLTATQPKVPWQTGDLERSGSAVVDRSNLDGVISFDQPYAVAQHEQLDWEHPLKGEPKYLETTLYEEAEVVRAMVAKAVRKALGG
ncbi:hypothetical protein [Nonomuraea wenchangensis]|uniref:Phage protein, HK97 gp10 family n=1 Tax=Nonomuraea wenchangensis TaxID=568860 RepID=A0A1I0LUW4_9ACTN|nr:hypothetical protein [Nonomuraea wenchangensis]SEU46613.1 hypothetical protein SAMN05421811_12794 [Nonomuraea wenchangensis]